MVSHGIALRCDSQCLLAILVGWIFAVCGIEGTMTTEVIHTRTRSGVDTPGIVRRLGSSLDYCAQACAKEKEIHCKYFKFLNATRTCLLSATDSPTVRRMAESRVPVLSIQDTDEDATDTYGRSKLGAWIKDLEYKIGDLESQKEDIEKMRTVLKDLRNEVTLLKRYRATDEQKLSTTKTSQNDAVGLLTRRLIGLKVDGEKFKAAVHALSNMQRVLAKEIGGLKDEQKDALLKLAEVEKSTSDQETITATLRGSDSALQRDVDSVKDGINDLSLRLDKLRGIVNKQITENKVSPLLIKIKHNQGALATALESVSEKVAGLIAEMPTVTSGLRRTDQKVSNQALYTRELQDKLKVLYKSLIQIRKDISDLVDPRSEVNMERANSILKLKSDVSMLAEMDKNIKSDLRDQKEDMARLIKDVARVQLMTQNLKDKLTLVLTASRQFQQDVSMLKEGQKNGLSVVEVAEMQKQVLVALNRLKTREALVMSQMHKYRESVQRVAALVRSTQGKKARTQRLVLQLQARFRHLEAQIQQLFHKTRIIASKMPQQLELKGISRLLNSQAQTNAKIFDLVREFDWLRARVARLSAVLEEDQVRLGNTKNMEVIKRKLPHANLEFVLDKGKR